MYGDLILPFLVVWPMFGAVAACALGRLSEDLRDIFAAATAIAELAVFITLFFTLAGNGELSFTWNSFGVPGINLTLDGFRLIFGAIAAFIWSSVLIWSREYFRHSRNRSRFCFFSLFTFGAAIGVFFAADIFTSFVFFEVMGLTSYVTIVNEETPCALGAGETYIAMTIAGGMVMLMGIFLLYQHIGMPPISELAASFQAAPDKRPLYIAGALILIGYGVKAGMFPMHIWLPDSYSAAPEPATAILSGILSKTGIFGVLILCSNMFLHEKGWGMAILALAAATMAVGSVMAVLCSDLKRTLAFSSMSQIGFILMGCAMQGILGDHNALAVRGTLLHMVNHSLIKFVLFTVAGVIFMNTGTLDLNAIRGYGRNKPLLAFGFLMGALGIAGIPLWNGYISKTLLHESIVEYIILVSGQTTEGRFFQAAEVFFVFCGGMTVAYMTKLFVALFLEKGYNATDNGEIGYIKGAAAWALVLPAMLLPVLGTLPSLLMDKLADMGQGFMNGESPHHAVHYFSRTNLTNTLWPLLIGATVYLLAVRPLLMRTNEDGRRIYINAWPSGISLELLFYRPLVNAMIWIGAFLSRAADRMTNVSIIIWIGAFLSRLADSLSNVSAFLWTGAFLSRLTDSLTNTRGLIWLGVFISRLADSAVNTRVVVWIGAFLSRLADSLPSLLARSSVKKAPQYQLSSRSNKENNDGERHMKKIHQRTLWLILLLIILCICLLAIFLTRKTWD